MASKPPADSCLEHCVSDTSASLQHNGTWLLLQLGVKKWENSWYVDREHLPPRNLVAWLPEVCIVVPLHVEGLNTETQHLFSWKASVKMSVQPRHAQNMYCSSMCASLFSLLCESLSLALSLSVSLCVCVCVCVCVFVTYLCEISKMATLLVDRFTNANLIHSCLDWKQFWGIVCFILSDRNTRYFLYNVPLWSMGYSMSGGRHWEKQATQKSKCICSYWRYFYST